MNPNVYCVDCGIAVNNKSYFLDGWPGERCLQCYRNIAAQENKDLFHYSEWPSYQSIDINDE